MPAVGEEPILCMTEDFLRGIATYWLPARSKEDGREEDQKDGAALKDNSKKRFRTITFPL